MDQEEEQQPEHPEQHPEQVPHQHAPPPPSIKIPPFWSSNPAAWFGMLDGQFILRNVQDQNMRFYNAIGAIPEQLVKTVADLLAGPPPADAYDQLKARLLQAHTLTEFQRMEKLLRPTAVSGQKPSDVLADLLQLCPQGETQTRIFRLIFLHHLPREIRILLAEDVVSPLNALAARADQLWSHGHRADPAVFAVAPDPEEDPTIAAVGGGHRSRGSGHRGRGGGQSRGGQPNRAGLGAAAGRGAPAALAAGAAGGPPPHKLARDSAGLCYAHWMFGDKAHSCRSPCSWQGN